MILPIRVFGVVMLVFWPYTVIQCTEESSCSSNLEDGGDGSCTSDDEFEEYDNDDDNDDDSEILYPDDPSCRNEFEDCEFWSKQIPSECDENPDFMHERCPLACRVCNRHNSYSDFSPTIDGRDLGELQTLDGDDDISSEDIENRIAESQNYMSKQLRMGNIDPEILRICKNDDELCTYWSLIGECDNNPVYMATRCGPACMACENLDINTRCPLNRDIIGPDVWMAGDLDKMFRRITTEPFLSRYDIHILSSPETNDGGPWVITIDNFVNDEEVERLIEMGSVEGYERSTDVGPMRLDGSTEEIVSTGRTSTNAWCSSKCIKDEFVKAVNDRISSTTQFPEVNSEDLQLLRYEPGQMYERHHDFIEYEVDRQGGVRLLTLYLYLNDVEAGGGTNFPDLNLTVMPKRGQVLIWPSVLDDNPNEKDDRTDHQALPVEAGIKYGANAWLHMRDFKNPHERGCS
mmetsp:Transcript_50312/g.56216  ORF Transcript_50312/g.56216 Transcript_50312/m.56216 type:complete len:461 (+) Transcript_50312:20-1402(+)